MQKAKKMLTGSVLALIIVFFMVFYTDSHKMLVYGENLDETAVTVDGEALSLEDIAFYVAYEETMIEKQAEIYSLFDADAYWKQYVGGENVKEAGKQAVLDMAVHDEIFYCMAKEEGLELSPEENAALVSKEGDFWADLTEEQKERLGVTEQKISDTMFRLALAEKYQTVLTERNSFDEEVHTYESYGVSGSNYKKILEDHTYSVNEKVWDKIDFGNVIVER